ncbi:hypothetical protein ACGFIU_03595 [Rhodococcus oryzae]|uniref:COG4705 family protein n=1 Tax=Rhodococcus oryzae TaxID=2571143 RepID=UPI00371D0226
MPSTRMMSSKVPEVTVYFWIIKVLATTVGETAADTLNADLDLGLTGTTVVMAVLLAGALYLQFRANRYVPWTYWLAVLLISVVGTLITDNLVDNLGVPLETTTAVFAIALAVTFAAWYASERTLSIHTIVTARREAFYWSAILFTFALGTAAGDLVAEQLDVGYWKSTLVFGALIGAVALARYGFRLNAVLAFWIAYVLTRPLGASLADLLSQDRDEGGLGLGATGTTVLFLGVGLGLVAYLTVTNTDELPPEQAGAAAGLGDGADRPVSANDRLG